MKRGRLVRLDCRAHDPEVAGSNPAPASIFLLLKPAQASKRASFYCLFRTCFRKIRLFSQRLRRAISHAKASWVNISVVPVWNVPVKQR